MDKEIEIIDGGLKVLEGCSGHGGQEQDNN